MWQWRAWERGVDGRPVCGGGVPSQPSNGSSVSGSVFVYRRDGSTWTRTARILPVVGAGEEAWAYGNAVVMRGDELYVATLSGKVYFYKRVGNNWTLTQTIRPTDVRIPSSFGSRMAIDGTTALFGDPADQSTNAAAGATSGSAGSAYLFTRSGDVWSQQAKLAPPAGTQVSLFANQLDFHGDFALVTASSDDVKGTDAGVGYLYKRSGSSWPLVARLYASNASGGDGLGGGATITDDYIMLGATGSVGSPVTQTSTGRTGAAFYYSRSGDGYGRCEAGSCVESQRYSPSVTAPNGGGFGSKFAGDAEVAFGAGAFYGTNAAGAVFPLELSARPSNVQASDGTYAARVR